jgi:FkbM family methyltransferase
MDLYHNSTPQFTEWVIANRYLQEPFVVIDVGVQGGEHPRWQYLGDMVRVYGFDALSEVIDQLQRDNAGRAHRHYTSLAIGSEDGKRVFYVSPDAFSSSFYPAPTPAAARLRPGNVPPGPRMVEMRRLDTLSEQGEIPEADYLKIDCEGYDPEVLRGADRYLARSNILCVSIETTFDLSPLYKRSVYAEVSDLVSAHRLITFDLNIVRKVRAAFVEALAAHPWHPADPMADAPDLDIGAPGTLDALFARDFVAEAVRPGDYLQRVDALVAPTPDKLIKAMINFELHGLMDCAVDLLTHFRDCLMTRFDPDEALTRLMARPPHARNTGDVVNALRMVAQLRTTVADLVAERETEIVARRARPVRRLGRYIMSRLRREV